MSRIAEHYSRYYENHMHDSHPDQRRQIINEVLGHRANYPEDYQLKVLDVGSGARVIADELTSHGVRVISLDFAVKRSGIFQKKGLHMMADGSRIPVPREGIDIVYSNMAMDLMPRRSFEEVYDVLRGGGYFIANLHHPRLFMNVDREQHEVALRISRARNKIRFGGSKGKRDGRERLNSANLEMDSLKFRRDEMPNMIFQNVSQLEVYFKLFNWKSLDVSECNSRNEEWWHVVAQK